MQTIGVSEFRANMNIVLQQVQGGEVISLLVRGKEVALLVPPDYARLAARKELEELRATAVLGDLITPLEEDWVEV